MNIRLIDLRNFGGVFAIFATLLVQSPDAHGEALNERKLITLSHQVCSTPEQLANNITRLRNGGEYVILDLKRPHPIWKEMYQAAPINRSPSSEKSDLFMLFGSGDQRRCCVSNFGSNKDVVMGLLTNKLGSPPIKLGVIKGQDIHVFEPKNSVATSVTVEVMPEGKLTQICHARLNKRQLAEFQMKFGTQKFSNNLHCETAFREMGVNESKIQMLCGPYWGTENAGRVNFEKCKLEARMVGRTVKEMCWITDPSRQSERDKKAQQTYALYMLLKEDPSKVNLLNED